MSREPTENSQQRAWSLVIPESSEPRFCHPRTRDVYEIGSPSYSTCGFMGRDSTHVEDADDAVIYADHQRKLQLLGVRRASQLRGFFLCLTDSLGLEVRLP